MRDFGRIAAVLLLVTFGGCLGRGQTTDEELASDVSAEPSRTAGEEILRLLDDMESSSEQGFDPAPRDPFAAVRADAPVVAPLRRGAPVAAPEPTPVPRLQGVLGGDGAATALIEGLPYGVGDRVAGFEIRAIDGDHIILERDGARHVVPVGRTLPGPGEGGIGS